jgi:hypothetical protein
MPVSSRCRVGGAARRRGTFPGSMIQRGSRGCWRPYWPTASTSSVAATVAPSVRIVPATAAACSRVWGIGAVLSAADRDSVVGVEASCAVPMPRSATRPARYGWSAAGAPAGRPAPAARRPRPPAPHSPAARTPAPPSPGPATAPRVPTAVRRLRARHTSTATHERAILPCPPARAPPSSVMKVRLREQQDRPNRQDC